MQTSAPLILHGMMGEALLWHPLVKKSRTPKESKFV
jgi:hypothetical protein